MIQEVKLKELKHIDFHIIYHAAKGLAEEKALLYNTLKQPSTLKDFSILQECIFLVQKKHLTDEKGIYSELDPKKKYSLKLKVHTALVIIDALHQFGYKDHPYAKSRIYWIKEQITKQTL